MRPVPLQDGQVGALTLWKPISRLTDSLPIQPFTPGDIHHTRMFPSTPPTSWRKTVFNTTSLGPSKADSLKSDFFIQQGLNPVNEFMNVQLLSRFVTNMGKIMNRAQTQLSWKNQRRLGKAIRRSRNLGYMPYFADWSENDIRVAKGKKGIIDTRNALY